MDTRAENITFMVVRGIVALAIVGVGFFCVNKGIEFFRLPRVEAEQILIDVLGLKINASGLGAVIFGTGLALCWIGKQTAPRRFGSMKLPEQTTQQVSVSEARESGVQRSTDSTPAKSPASETENILITEVTIIAAPPSSPPSRFD